MDVTALSQGITQVTGADYDAAVITLRALADTNPDDANIQYWLGRAYYGERLYHLAAEKLAVAFTRDAGNKDACLWYARALRSAGKTQDALAVYAAYHQSYPADSIVLGEFAQTCALAGNYEAARSSFALLAQRDPSPPTRALVEEWNAVLNGLSSKAQLEPPRKQKVDRFELCYDPRDTSAYTVQEVVESARRQTAEVLGGKLEGFRVLVFPDWNSYSRYARILLPESSGLYAKAFSLPDLLVLWSPNTWPVRANTQDELANTIRHEMVHLAIYKRSNGEGVPIWLNEGLACAISGWSGALTGSIPVKPLDPQALNKAFLTGNMDTQESAYAQAHAMARVLLRQLGNAGVGKLLDALTNGTTLSTAYQQIAGEPFSTFLANWPEKYAALPKEK
ncbi:MAG: hypothetical protein ACYDBB_23325 [Armatimonadota bacterium]